MTTWDDLHWVLSHKCSSDTQYFQHNELHMYYDIKASRPLVPSARAARSRRPLAPPARAPCSRRPLAPPARAVRSR